MTIFTIPMKKILLYGDQCLTGTCCFWNYSPIGKNVCVIFYIDFVRGTPFQKAKIIQKLSVSVYYQKHLSDLDTLIKITIMKIIIFQHQKYSFNIKLLKLIWFKLWRGKKSCVPFLVSYHITFSFFVTIGNPRWLPPKVKFNIWPSEKNR